MDSEEDLPPVLDPQFLKRAFATESACLAAKLQSSSRITHAGDRGEVNEQFFIETLRRYLPDRYTVEKALVLDSNGAVSDSIDVVVFDRQYTPTLLDSEKHRYVPAEAVYAVFECKPSINKGHLRYAGDKAASVRRLHRTSVPIPTTSGVHPPKAPFPIVAGILATKVEWAEGLGETFEARHAELTGDRCIDCGLALDGAFDVYDGRYTMSPRGNSLAFFVFRLLHKLQSLGTAPAVDWNAYARRLSEHE